jgi:hypothetical protein
MVRDYQVRPLLNTASERRNPVSLRLRSTYIRAQTKGYIMELGSLGSYRLPAALRDAYGVDTAQQLADHLGVTKQPTPDLAGEADAAYRALKAGDPLPARRLLVERLGVSEANADEAIERLPAL